MRKSGPGNISTQAQTPKDTLHTVQSAPRGGRASVAQLGHLPLQRVASLHLLPLHLPIACNIVKFYYPAYEYQSLAGSVKQGRTQLFNM